MSVTPASLVLELQSLDRKKTDPKLISIIHHIILMLGDSEHAVNAGTEQWRTETDIELRGVQQKHSSLPQSLKNLGSRRDFLD